MENMKRAISAFMALVLVLGMLPGVPMFAGAEEVETQPETVAVETTEAVTVPEEESVPETTVAEEPVPETTAAEETVPETTAAEETVPETTVAEETVPETTVAEETVPAETVEELIATEEAVDDYIVKYVNDIQIEASKDVTYWGEQVKLTATVFPEDAKVKTVEFYVLENDGDVVWNETVLKEQGILIAEEGTGDLTIAAKATDNGEESWDSKDQEEGKGGTVKVTVVEYSMELNRTAGLFEEENVHEYNADETEVEVLKVMTGKKVALDAHYLVNGKPERALTTPDVTWYLGEGDDRYATVTVDPDNCMEVTITGKAVTETKAITLYAKDETIDAVDSIQILVYPIPYKVGIYLGDEELTNKTLTVPLLASEIEELKAEDIDYLVRELTAKVWPEEAEEPMVWTCSDDLVQVIHPEIEDPDAEEGAEPELDTSMATARIYPITEPKDTTVITISSKNYPDVKATLTIVRKWCLETKDIDFGYETWRLSTDGVGLVEGESFQLEVYDIRDKQNAKLLNKQTVKWFLSEEDQAYATISENGKLTARKEITTGAEVTVKCAVIDNEEACLELPVIIRPKATEIRILPGDLAGEDLEEDAILNDQTIAVDTADGRKPFNLGFEAWPMDEVSAKQDVTWKSSNTKIATIDPVTEEIVWEGKNGTVTITATAADGSGKKASVKLKFGAQIRELTIVEDDEDIFLRSGQSWSFEVEFLPVNPTNKSLTWSLVNEADKKYASISSSGKLKAKTVYEEHTITVRATAKDGSGAYDDVEVIIKPKKDGILTLKGFGEYVSAYENYVTKTTQLVPVGEEIDLEAYILGETETEYVKWKSSSKNAELSDVYGGSTTVTVLKTGTFTITATSQEDTDKKATVKLKGVRMTDYIEWTHTHEQTELACGKSLTLKAKAYDAEDKTPSISKLAWSIAEGGEKYAKVSGGKVTAIAGTLTPYDEPVDITVVVKATDGSGVEETYGITIYPVVQSVTIDQPDDVYINTPSKGTNTYVMMMPGEESIHMSAQVWPQNAMNDVTWKSSNKSIAEIDKESGELVCKKAGTVTITATAADGSGKKGTFKLTILVRPYEVQFDVDHFVVGGGKNLKLKPVLLDGNGDKVSGKKLEWSVAPYPGEDEDDGTAYVTSISGGTLKTKKVTEKKRVIVNVRTVEKHDDWEVEASVPVEIYPATSSLKILYNGSDAGSKIWSYLGDEQIILSGTATSKYGLTENDIPYQTFTWKTSNKKIATVEDGVVTFHKAGTVTIYAYAADGTSVKDSVKITIRK